MEPITAEIERRGDLLVALMPDGTEWTVGNWQHLIRVALGEFKED